MSTTFCPGSPDSGTGRYCIASSACTNGIGMCPEVALRKNSALTGCAHSASAKSRTFSHRGRSSGFGRRLSTLMPRVASMFSPSTTRYVVPGSVSAALSVMPRA